MTIAAVGGEIKKAIRPPAGEVLALFEARIDDRDADLVAVVAALGQSEGVDEHVLEPGRALRLPPSRSRIQDCIDRNRLHVWVRFEGLKIVAVNSRGHGIEAPVIRFDAIAVLAQTIRDRGGTPGSCAHDHALWRRISAGNRFPEYAIELGWFWCRSSATVRLVDVRIRECRDERRDQRSVSDDTLQSSSSRKTTRHGSPRSKGSMNCNVRYEQE